MGNANFCIQHMTLRLRLRSTAYPMRAKNFASAALMLVGSVICQAAHSDTLASQREASPVGKGDPSTVTSCWARRGHGMVLQTEDRTCGAASLATLLQLQSTKRWSEKEILAKLPDRNRVSLADLEVVARRLGYRTRLAAVSWQTLSKTTSPVLLYFKSDTPQLMGHFVVLAGVNKSHALILDPSWGRKTYSASQLLARWELAEQSNEKGYILAVLPPVNAPRSAKMQCDYADREHALSVAREAMVATMRLPSSMLFADGRNLSEVENDCR